MALPIGETPILRGREAADFINKICNDSVKAVSLVPTPKLDEACKLIKGHAKKQQKRDS